MLTIQNCASSNIPRLGGLLCGEKLMIGFYLKKRGFLIDPETFDKAALDQLIQEDKLIGMIEFFSVEDADQDAGTATSSRNEVIQTMPGTKGYTFTFNNGSCYQNQLQLLNGRKDYEFIPVFEDGSALFAVTKDGQLKGFDCNLYTGVKQYQISSDVAGSTLMVYITPNAMKFWQGNAYTYESDDFSFDEITPVAGLNIKLPVLVSGATSTTVTITHLCSGATVSGLTTASNWKLERNGVLEAITGTVTEVAGVYTFNHSALVAGDKIRILTSVLGYPVYALDTNYYAGASNIEEVA